MLACRLYILRLSTSYNECFFSPHCTPIVFGHAIMVTTTGLIISSSNVDNSACCEDVRYLSITCAMQRHCRRSTRRSTSDARSCIASAVIAVSRTLDNELVWQQLWLLCRWEAVVSCSGRRTSFIVCRPTNQLICNNCTWWHFTQHQRWSTATKVGDQRSVLWLTAKTRIREIRPL